EGRVHRIRVRPGTPVSADTVILELGNSELEVAAVDAEFQLQAAEASLADLGASLQSRVLDQKATAAQVDADFREAKLVAERDKKLRDVGLIPDFQLNISVAKAELLGERSDLEKQRVTALGQSVKAQLAAQEVKIEQARAQCNLKRDQLESLKVRAGIAGTLQQVLVEVGEWVPAGTILAKVAQPSKLKAALRVQETEAKDLQIGQSAEVDTRNGTVPGHVIRIDPAVVEGTVTVDVQIDGRLPPGARPDLSVDGIIEVERLLDVLYVGRPASGQPNSEIGLFKLVKGGTEAHRVQAKLGRASVSTVELLRGFEAGDQVILSDMSAWDSTDRVRLN
ncbi:MAG: HlyD family efflux transporter periplasmic adaptor subunit, partial [Bryobacteraceae bacterium]